MRMAQLNKTPLRVWRKPRYRARARTVLVVSPPLCSATSRTTPVSAYQRSACFADAKSPPRSSNHASIARVIAAPFCLRAAPPFLAESNHTIVCVGG